VYRGSLDAAIANAIQVPVNDPLLLIPAMAYNTRNLGFGVTCAVSYEHPYTLARRFSTLDHLTGGRIGWNVVTGYLNSAAKSMGLARQPEHDTRYEIAEEYMQIVYELWEGSWEEKRGRSGCGEPPGIGLPRYRGGRNRAMVGCGGTGERAVLARRDMERRFSAPPAAITAQHGAGS
jgi:alkanesulfonate monooxygenase SsuD/methylene tetrahydromethanopterin reductase-like flavin-dependent oxidoreductase (luciferase family)